MDLNVCPCQNIISLSWNPHWENLLNNVLDIHKISSPVRNIALFNLARYILTGDIVPHSILGNVLKLGYSPIDLIFKKPRVCNSTVLSDGCVDSLKLLLYSDSFIKPYSNEHILVHLLTTAL